MCFFQVVQILSILMSDPLQIFCQGKDIHLVGLHEERLDISSRNLLCVIFSRTVLMSVAMTPGEVQSLPNCTEAPFPGSIASDSQTDLYLCLFFVFLPSFSSSSRMEPPAALLSSSRSLFGSWFLMRCKRRRRRRHEFMAGW